jgi:hypothetical protein
MRAGAEFVVDAWEGRGEDAAGEPVRTALGSRPGRVGVDVRPETS